MQRPSPAQPARDSAALLDRDEAFATLEACLDLVQRSGRGQVLLVGGEAGVGKTALLRQFCEGRMRASRVLWGACDPLFTPRPLGPLLLMAEGTGSQLERVIEHGAMPHEVFSALTRELRARAGTILVLEDAHWADEATLDVLKLLTRRVESLPSLVIVSFRDDELDRDHLFRRVLGEFATHHAVRRLKLPPLSRTAVATLAEPFNIDAEELFRKTAGNAFFVAEVLAAGTLDIPDSVRDAVLARAARLSPGARALLDAVAIVPSQAELWLLQALDVEDSAFLDECLHSGVLVSQMHGVAFRHELARLAIDGSIALGRKIGLHRRAFAALLEPQTGAVDVARLAHHAEMAGDVAGVLRFAPAAASRATEQGSYREAAAQYARALRFGDSLTPGERAELLENQARACYITDQYDTGISALEDALRCRRALGDALKEGDVLRRLSEFLWCPGRTSEAEHAARQAVHLLDQLPSSHELALAYANLADILACGRSPEALEWTQRALELADRLDAADIAIYALAIRGVCEPGNGGEQLLHQSLERARTTHLADRAGLAYMWLVEAAVDQHRGADAKRLIESGLEYCSNNGLELFRLYLLAHRARLELDEGRWTEAAASAATVLRIQRTSTTPRIIALVVQGLVRARRGDSEHWAPLNEAWQLARPTGELPRLGPVAAARAEVAWLDGDRNAVASAAEGALALAIERRAVWTAGQLAVWLRRADCVAADVPEAPEPYVSALRGDWRSAAARWTALHRPYEAALAMADTDDEEALRQAFDDLQRLGARPAAGIIARRLRERGARGLPRGPRATTRRNPNGLTARELEVLELVAQGLRDQEIAERLALSSRTVSHHVSAVLGKLGAHTRSEASGRAAQLGLTWHSSHLTAG
jgi:DNA-binding CsgD family transcriptional regulator/tetratricopeptide (TPR) repeat protein